MVDRLKKNIEIIQYVLGNQLMNPLLLFMIQLTVISGFKFVWTVIRVQK